MKQKLLIAATILILNGTFLSFNCSAQFTKIHDFNGLDGNNPGGSLFFDGTYLYGTTIVGGTYNKGVIFKIKPDGTSHTVLFNFSGTTDGSTPDGGTLISDGTFLYGMTHDGGTNNKGVIFRIKPDGTAYFNLLEFAGILNGSFPEGSLYFDGTYLYGATLGGGLNNFGTIFKIKPNGTGYTKLLDFAGAANGRYPYYGALISDGTFLYGMTEQGGSNDKGVVFKIKPDGTGYLNLLDFTGLLNGSHPDGSLFFDGTFLYGMTKNGGSNDMGVAFKIKPNGTLYTLLKIFTGIPDGSYPYSSFISDGSYLYGTTVYGGSNDKGLVFKIKSDGTEFTNLINFDFATTGANVWGDLISDGYFFYGMTGAGGINNIGTIFKFHDTTNCVAHYLTSYDSIQNTFNVTVDSATTALAISYHWNFGDGTSSTLATPTHTYTVDTLYNVCMKIYTATGDSCTYCHIIGKDASGNVIRNAGFTINVHNANSTTGISQNNSEDAKIKIYPNPTNGVFNLQMNKFENLQMKIYNVLGECIYQRFGTFSNYQIDLSNQPNGIYFMNLKTEEGVVSKKIIINR